MKNNNRTWIVALGTAFEYYDFVIYALFIKAIAGQFFSAEGTSLWMAIAVFSGGYLVRPLGGVLFGLCGDKYGRKQVFYVSMLLMACATFAMGALPGHAAGGIACTALFVVARLLQGLSYGAEMPGAMVYLAESTSNADRGRSFSLMLLGTCVGVVYWVETLLLDGAAIAEWGWRLPFLFGGALAFVASIFRKKLSETAVFARREQRALGCINAQQLALSPASLLLVLFPASYVMLNSLFMPLYIAAHAVDIAAGSVAAALFIGNAWCGLLLPIAGRLVDAFGGMKIYRRLLIAALALVPLVFITLTAYGTLWSVYLFVLVNQTLLAFFAPTYMTFIPAAFSTGHRYTATALVYNIAYSIASFVPALLLQATVVQHAWAAWLLYDALAVAALVASFFFARRGRMEIDSGGRM